jgi:tetratricopeptide (TPR) repeat protein
MNAITKPHLNDEPKTNLAVSTEIPALSIASIPRETQNLLGQMFSDPYLLEKDERTGLVNQLRDHVTQHPNVAGLRVLLGMALCVNLEAQAAIEELREAVRLAPDSYIAQLKLGELWMRLRVIDKAEEHTRLAALLAQSLVQSELARRQAASIRGMKRAGIERGAYALPLRVVPALRRLWTRRRGEPSVVLDIG